MEDILKILQSLKESGLLIKKSASETMGHKAKEQKYIISGILLGTLVY